MRLWDECKVSKHKVCHQKTYDHHQCISAHTWSCTRQNKCPSGWQSQTAVMGRDCLQMTSIIYDMDVAVSIYSIFIYALRLDISTYSVYRLINSISKHTFVRYLSCDQAARHLSTAPVNRNPALVIPALPAFYHHTSVCPPPPPQYSPHTAHRALEAEGQKTTVNWE